jgi:hypothetical protein
METATATMIEKNAFMVLKVSLLTAHVRLSDCRRDCAVGSLIRVRQTRFHPHAQCNASAARDARQQ